MAATDFEITDTPDVNGNLAVGAIHQVIGAACVICFEFGRFQPDRASILAEKLVDYLKEHPL